MDHKKWISEGKYKFYIASERDIPDLIAFVQNNFLDYEPIMRNIGIMAGTNILDRYLRIEICKRLVTDFITHAGSTPSCVVARSTIDDSILGCRMGKVVSRKEAKNKSKIQSHV